MKRFILTLAVTLAVAPLCKAASTDTHHPTNVEIDEGVAAINRQLAQIDQRLGFEVAETDAAPEQKVVEIHMTRNEPATQPEGKKNKRRNIDIVPLPGHGTCSGEFVGDEGEILTAKHCVDGFDSFEVQTADRRLYTAVVVATSTTHDLAMIRIDRSNTPYFKLAKALTRGEHISVLGSPLGITDTLSTGVIARNDGDVLLLDCGALPGNSGGPVFNEDGELVGVLNAGFIVMLGTTHLNMAQGLDAVRFFIREVAQRYPNGRR